MPKRAPSPRVLRRGSDGVLPSQGDLDRPGLHRGPLPRPPEGLARPDRARWRLPLDHVSNALRRAQAAILMAVHRGAAMTTIERGGYRRAASTGAIVVAAMLVAIASGGCSSGSSESASRPRAVHDRRSHRERAGVGRDGSAGDHRHRPVPLVGRRHCDRARERVAAARRGECPRRRVRRAKSGGRRCHRRHRHRVRPCRHPAGRGRAQRCRHGAARLQRRSRAATPAHRPQQRRRARGRRPLPPTAGAATGPAASRSCHSVRTRTWPDSSPHRPGAGWSPRRSSGW